MNNTSRNNWAAFAAVLLVVGAGLGYAIARLTGSGTKVAPAEAPASASQPDSLVLPENFLATMGIATETVTAGDLSSEIQAPGSVTAAPNGQAFVSARAQGTVVRVMKRLGDAVRAGEVLALVESRDAAAMTAERNTAESRAELARSALKREQSLYDQKVTPRQELEAAQAQLVAAEAEATRAKAAAEAAGVTRDGRTLAVTSPLSGRITASNASLGAHVEPQMELFRVADPRYVVIEASVTAQDARRITAGTAATVTSASGANLEAKVVSVTPTLNEETRAATVSLSLASAAGLTPGEFVQVRIKLKAEGTKAFLVPEESIQVWNGRDVVFVRTKDGFKATPVVVGARSGGRASVLSGLHPDDRIATTNAFLLKAEIGKGAEEEE